jgi:hypothetical protein
MKNKLLSFICIGQAGGNIGYLLEQHGYNCLFVNTSKEDLSTLNVKYRYLIKNGDGANHSREKAIQLLKADYNSIIDEISDKLGHSSLIYLIFSTGGGTGSGVAPILLEMLNSKFPQKHFGCITILPSTDEQPKPQINAVKCFEEITNIDKLTSVFTLDNSKLDKFMINKSFVQQFNTMLDIPNHTNTKGNIDKAELWEMLITRGGAMFTTTNANTNITPSIIKSWENNYFVSLEKDKNIVYMGLSITDDINIDDLKKYIGTPYDIFKNYNRDQTVTLLTGLSFPKTRINDIIEGLNIDKDTIIKNKINSKMTKIHSDLEWLNSLESSQSIDIRGIDDILQKYA